MKYTELLAPAGDLEKLKTAVAFGADAVYIGGHDFGLRARSKNFDLSEMAEGIRFAHERQRRVYVAANIFAHNADIDRMAGFFRDVREAGADALIISDPGVFALARETVPDMDIHISTQANNTNYRGAAFWQKLGAKRVVLARELSLPEIARINAENPGLELEAFVHGAMCVSYSGRCLLSNYLSGRDANQGDCVQSCRWEYAVVERERPGEYLTIDEDKLGTYIFNSKDLCMIEHIPELINSGIMSFKIEGRVKSAYYVGCVVKAYRAAIDDYYADPERYAKHTKEYYAEVTKVSHRPYTTGFYIPRSSVHGDSAVYSGAYNRGYDFIATVTGYDPETAFARIEQRNKFSVGDEIEIVRAGRPNFLQTADILTDADGNAVTDAPHPQQRLRIKVEQPVNEFDMIRKRRDD
ncbi:MAG: U32 family peptidase [Defluviitaleaceae bacterium]|nr:U32 family peptidase [Defluviitaleaceae bacterium]